MTTKDKILYWLLQLTWGLLGTIIGSFTCLFFICCGFKPQQRNGHVLMTISWIHGASFSIGPFVFLGNNCESLYPHEFGHSLQNAIFGPIMLFIYLASVIRFWYREAVYKIDAAKYFTLPSYESIWFEGQATRWGTKQLNRKIER